jgi:hypothetical protein
MSASDCRAARRKNLLRYGHGRNARSVADAIVEERRKAARQAKAATKRKAA